MCVCIGGISEVNDDNDDRLSVRFDTKSTNEL